MWFYSFPDADQATASNLYVLDARNDLSDGYLWYNIAARTTGNVIKGNGFSKLRWHDMSTSSPTVAGAGGSMLLGRWYHLYAEASAAFSGSPNIFARYTSAEIMYARVASIVVWSRALTDAEVDTLASGGAKPSDTSALLASYNADDATHTTIPDGANTGNGAASIVGGLALPEGLTASGGLPSCIPNLGTPLPPGLPL